MPLLTFPWPQILSADGSTYPGAKLFFYETGTSTLATTYSDAGLTTPHTNPVIADATGVFPPIYLANKRYKAILRTAGDVTLFTADPVTGGGDNTVATIAAMTAIDSPTNGTTVQVSDLDRGGYFVFDTTSTSAADNGTTFKADDATSGSWVRQYSGAVHARWFNVTADGVTNDTAEFKKIEALSGSVVDLGGQTYAVQSVVAAGANGVTLKKDYRNGTLLMDGKVRVFDSVSGMASAGASVARMLEPSTNKSLGIFREDENNYYVWRPLGGHYWQRNKLTRASNTLPFNWNEIYLKQVFGYITAEATEVAYTGGWATEGETTWLWSDDEAVYVGGRARQATTAGDYVEVTYSGGGDLYVIYTGRTSGNYVNVLLDGSSDYLILPDDGSGNKYFDSYTAVDFSNKLVVKIAEAVPNGDHTIRLTLSASKNASSTGDRFIFNALSFDSDEMGPWRRESDAPKWTTGDAVLKSQVRKHLGNYYYASAAGTTGATPPTHTSGSASDGGVTWVYRAAGGYDLTDHRIQAAGSQLEYAYEIKPSGASAKEDVGGVAHGNETQTSAKFVAAGNEVALADLDWRVGSSIAVVEDIEATHSEIGGGSTPVMNTVLRRTFSRRGVEIYHKHTLQFLSELGYFYPHMWPLLHYSSVGAKYGVNRIWSPGDGFRDCADFYGQSNPFVGSTKDLFMAAYGRAFQPDGSAGVPTSTEAPLGFVAWVAVDPQSVDFYRDAKELFAVKAMNTSGADVSAGGFSSMTSKIYFERYSSAAPVSKPAGYVIESSAIYGLALIAR